MAAPYLSVGANAASRGDIPPLNMPRGTPPSGLSEEAGTELGERIAASSNRFSDGFVVEDWAAGSSAVLTAAAILCVASCELLDSAANRDIACLAGAGDDVMWAELRVSAADVRCWLASVSRTGGVCCCDCCAAAASGPGHSPEADGRQLADRAWKASHAACAWANVLPTPSASTTSCTGHSTQCHHMASVLPKPFTMWICLATRCGNPDFALGMPLSQARLHAPTCNLAGSLAGGCLYPLFAGMNTKSVV